MTQVDLGRGTVRWTKRFAAARTLKDTDTTSKAAPTPAVDADGVYAMFESGDVIGVSHDGRLRWRRSLMDDYGEIKNGHQYGSSPVLLRDSLLIFVGHAGLSYLLRLETRSGATVWKAERPSVTSAVDRAIVLRTDTAPSRAASIAWIARSPGSASIHTATRRTTPCDGWRPDGRPHSPPNR